MTRNSPGSGSYEVLPSGRIRYTLKVAGVTYRNVCADREAAQREVAAVLQELAAGGQPTLGAVTLAGWGERWIANRTNRAAEDDRNRWRRHIAGSDLAAMPLTEITRKDVRAWVAELGRKRATKTAQGGKRVSTRAMLSAQSQKHVLGLLRQALAAAVDAELLDANPAEGIRVAPQQEREARVREYLQPAEVEALFALPLPTRVRSAYSIAIYAGLRPGELFALKWEDVHLEAPHPHVVVRRSHGSTTKTKRARVVPLLEPARVALAAWRAEAPRNVLVWPSPRGGRYGVGYDFGWKDHKASPKRPPTPGWRSKAAIPASREFYSMRHTCATGLLQGWWTEEPLRLEEVRVVMGHTNQATTQIYAHLAGTDLFGRFAPRVPRESHEVTQVHDNQGDRGALLSRGPQVRDLPGALSPSTRRVFCERHD